MPGGGRSALVVASPSPFYVFLLLDTLDRGGEPILVTGSIVTSIVWILFGLLFLALARSRTSRVIAAHEVALAESDRILAEEDAAAARAAAEAAAQMAAYEAARAAAEAQAAQAPAGGPEGAPEPAPT